VLTVVQRILILKGADLFSDVGPRHLLGLADVAREMEMSKGDVIYKEEDPADALYMVVEGRVRLSTGDRMMSEVGSGEAFGTWSLVDDNARGHRAECIEDGLTLALNRDEFYDVAAGDLTLLQEVVRALGKRLRTLVAERPEEARVEGEGIEKPQALAEAKPGLESNASTPPSESEAEAEAAPTRGATLAAAAVGRPSPDGDAPAAAPEPPIAPGDSTSSGPIPSVGPPEPK